MSPRKPPSLKQCRARSLDVHRKILRAVADDVAADRATGATSAGSYRGLRKAFGTLLGWGCIEDGQLTERGRELLEMLESL